MTADGLVTLASHFGVTETIDRLADAVKAKGMTVFARIDHAAGAAAAGLALRPTDLLIFGSAKAGTPLMQADPAIGIDLPLKALAYQDSSGNVWLAYNDPKWLTQRHGIEETLVPGITAMATGLEALARQAAGVS